MATRLLTLSATLLVAARLVVSIATTGTLAIRLTLATTLVSPALIASTIATSTAVILAIIPAAMVAEVLVFVVIPAIDVIGAVVGIILREQATIAALADIEEGTALGVAALEVEVFVLLLADDTMNGSDVSAAALAADAWKLREDRRLNEEVLGVACIQLDD